MAKFSPRNRRLVLFVIMALLGYLIGYTVISFILRPDPEERSIQQLPAPGLNQ